MIDWDLVKQLYDQGKTDKEISSEINCSMSSVIYWRERNKLPVNPTIIDCSDCGRPFEKIKNAIRCDECKKLHKEDNLEQYYAIRNIRKHYCYLCAESVDRAKAFAEEMLIIEGKEFCNRVLGDLIERTQQIHDQMMENRRDRRANGGN